MQDIKRWIIAMAGAATLAMALPELGQSVPNLKIGVIGPFTGPSSDFGLQMLQGVQLATDEINAVGGYMGRQLTPVSKAPRNWWLKA